MNSRLQEALDVLGTVDAEDAAPEARGRRAHARVIAMIEFADQVSSLRQEMRIANLLALASTSSERARDAAEEAEEMLFGQPDEVPERTAA